MTVSMHDVDTRGSGAFHGANRTKAKDRVLWVVRAALALGLVSAGSLEISGAVGLLIGRFAAPAAAGVTALMIGAATTNIFVIHVSPALPLAFLAAAIVIVRGRRHELKALLRLAPGG